MANAPPPFEDLQALIFDLMGTCTDWHSSIVSSMRRCPVPTPLQDKHLPGLASEWRAGFFKAVFAKFEAGEDPPDIDVVHAAVLDELLSKRGVTQEVWDASIRADLVSSWHSQQRKFYDFPS
jgi:hypothetical protein